MSEWVRLWADMPNDPKWRVICHRASQTVTNRHSDIRVCEVVSIFVHMLINASNWTNWGRLENWNDEVVGAALDIEKESVLSIRNAMQGLVLDGDRILNWEKRQTKHADSSAERTAKWRRRKRDGCDEDVTDGDGSETPSDGGDAHVTQKRRDKIYIDLSSKDLSPKKFGQRTFSKKMEFEKEDFERFWTAYGHKVQRKRAEAAFAKAVRKAPVETILDGVERYRKTRPAWQEISLAATWLDGERWTDELDGQSSCPTRRGAPSKHPPQFFIEVDTPQWTAWSEFAKQSGRRGWPQVTHSETRKQGWYFPSEWPLTGESSPKVQKSEVQWPTA